MKKRNKVIAWIKEHKKKLVLAGISIAGLIATVMLLKNREQLEEFFESLKKAVEDENYDSSLQKISCSEIKPEMVSSSESAVPITRSPHAVKEFVRNLPLGYEASPQKRELAKEKGIDLLSNQTIVNSYRTGVGAA